MLTNLNKKLRLLSENLKKPLYVVGGTVRNYLIDKSFATDIDLAAAIPLDEFICAAQKTGLEVVAVYKRTSTVVIKADGEKFEYTAFRKEEYASGGGHTPEKVLFTDSVEEDARRRDFKCNAVYYDIKNDKLVDPLGGIADIAAKRLTTVVSAKEVFSHDGLRLMRLARFAGELGFTPTEQTTEGAKNYADNISDISPERIYDELKKILNSDAKYPFSDKSGHYTGLKILDETRVLDRVIPELTLGRGMSQRADFHKFDVLEHSLRCALYAERGVRLAALLHDVGKPYCFIKTGKYHEHDKEGEKIAESILKRLKADNETIRCVKYLVREHMVDLDAKTSERKVRRYLVKNREQLDRLLFVKQADFRASLETDDVAPTVKKWTEIYENMKKEGVPMSYGELKITAYDLMQSGFKGAEIGKAMNTLLYHAVDNPKDNDKNKLLSIAEKLLKRDADK